MLYTLTMKKIFIAGEVAKGFEKVRREFEKNFEERGELGAACAVYYRGEKIVDLWGGYRDGKKQTPWEKDTLVHVFSTTKGIAALTVAVAVSQGLFEYDDKVSKYWPEFAQNGKENITIRQLMSFQAGLCYIDQKLDNTMIADLDRLAALLAKQKLAWNPGDYHGYHLYTAGWCASELIRRTDKKHRTLGQFLHEEIVKPLNEEFYIGVPPTVPEERFAVIKEFPLFKLLFHLDSMPRGMVIDLFRPHSLVSKVMLNVKVKTPAQMGLPPYRYIEMPGGNGIGLVRSLAKMYGVFAMGGKELGLKKKILEELMKPAIFPKKGIMDKVLQTNMVYSLGFIKSFPEFNFSPSSKAFGGAGTGGSNAFADPDAEIGFAYAPNQLGFHQFNDPRERCLRESVYECLAAL